ncbi:MAG: hypothetical protein EXS10_10240 [Phycisphaerales bacterium]|nr:hypothetical protein [Phycisphaerales bacterium]
MPEFNQSAPLRVLITAGPTEEPIDDVRFIGNRSSGKLGCAIANAFAECGHDSTLLLGTVGVSPAIDPRVRTKRFRTAQDLNELLRFEWPSQDLLIMAAAVADFRPTNVREGKMRRSTDQLSIQLVAVPDLVASLGDITRSDQRRVAFALEAREGMLEAATRKLRAKNVDAIVANPLETMESSGIEATLMWSNGKTIAPGWMPKQVFARWLVEQLTLVAS